MSRHLPMITVLASCGLLAAAQVWLSHMRIELTHQSQRVADEQAAVSHELQNLRLELASLARPERLRRIAQEQLHMGPPQPMQVLQP
jgi:cell division protein FtsL